LSVALDRGGRNGHRRRPALVHIHPDWNQEASESSVIYDSPDSGNSKPEVSILWRRADGLADGQFQSLGYRQSASPSPKWGVAWPACHSEITNEPRTYIARDHQSQSRQRPELRLRVDGHTTCAARSALSGVAPSRTVCAFWVAAGVRHGNVRWRTCCTTPCFKPPKVRRWRSR
jgi:hypothetical protein